MWKALSAVRRMWSVLASLDTVTTRNILLLSVLFPSYTFIISKTINFTYFTNIAMLKMYMNNLNHFPSISIITETENKTLHLARDMVFFAQL